MLLTTTGQWMQEDPIQQGGGQPNFREYGFNDPSNETDWTGLQATKQEKRVLTTTVEPKLIGPTGYYAGKKGVFALPINFRLKKATSSGGIILLKMKVEGAAIGNGEKLFALIVPKGAQEPDTGPDPAFQMKEWAAKIEELKKNGVFPREVVEDFWYGPSQGELLTDKVKAQSWTSYFAESKAGSITIYLKAMYLDSRSEEFLTRGNGFSKTKVSEGTVRGTLQYIGKKDLDDVMKDLGRAAQKSTELNRAIYVSWDEKKPTVSIRVTIEK
jgi:hypothetical protein